MTALQRAARRVRGRVLVALALFPAVPLVAAFFASHALAWCVAAAAVWLAFVSRHGFSRAARRGLFAAAALGAVLWVATFLLLDWR